jgi:hypothetical protein
VLVKLLRLIASEGRADSAELAGRLGVAPALMQSMLDTLARQGYLKPVVITPAAACAHCPMRGGCLSGAKARLWTLSEKGKRALEKSVDKSSD